MGDICPQAIVFCQFEQKPCGLLGDGQNSIPTVGHRVLLGVLLDRAEAKPLEIGNLALVLN